MKKDLFEYRVIYENGNEETFYTFSFLQCFCDATLYAINKAWDVRIKYIHNNTDGLQIEYPSLSFNYSK